MKSHNHFTGLLHLVFWRYQWGLCLDWQRGNEKGEKPGYVVSTTVPRTRGTTQTHSGNILNLNLIRKIKVFNLMKNLSDKGEIRGD